MCSLPAEAGRLSGSIPLLGDVCALPLPPSRGQQLTSCFLTSQGQTGAPGFPGDAGDRGYTVRPSPRKPACCNRCVITHVTVSVTFRVVLSLRVTPDRRDAAGQAAQRYKHVCLAPAWVPIRPHQWKRYLLALSLQTGAQPVDLCVLLLSQGSRGQDGLPGSDGEPGEDVSALAFKAGPCVWLRW